MTIWYRYEDLFISEAVDNWILLIGCNFRSLITFWEIEEWLDPVSISAIKGLVVLVLSIISWLLSVLTALTMTNVKGCHWELFVLLSFPL